MENDQKDGDHGFPKKGEDHSEQVVGQKRKRVFTKTERNRFKKQKRKENSKKRALKRKEEREQKLAEMSEEQRTKFLEDEHLKREKIKEARIARQELEAKRLGESLTNGQRIVFDLNWTEGAKQKKKDITGVVRQLGYAYSSNKRDEKPLQYHICAQQEFEPIFHKMGIINWKAHLHYKPIEDVFKKSELIYLSPDAEEELTYPLDKTKVYVIGGITDRTVIKNLTKNRADKLGIQCRKLSIPPTMNLCKNAFNINTVTDALLKFQYTNEWHKVLEEVVPARNHKSETAKNKRRKFKKQKPQEKNKPKDEENDEELKHDLDFFVNKIQKRNTSTA